MFFTKFLITQQNEKILYNIALPPYNENVQITIEHIANNFKIFYNNTTYNLSLPINTTNNRIRTISTQENDEVILKIGDDNSRWYNMAFRLNSIWSDSQKIALID